MDAGTTVKGKTKQQKTVAEIIVTHESQRKLLSWRGEEKNGRPACGKKEDREGTTEWKKKGQRAFTAPLLTITHFDSNEKKCCQFWLESVSTGSIKNELYAFFLDI